MFVDKIEIVKNNTNKPTVASGINSGNAGFGGGVSIDPGANAALVSTTFTPPPGAKIALISISGAASGTAGAAALIRIDVEANYSYKVM